MARPDELSGYQIVLDLLVARYFAIADGPELLRLGADLDLSSRQRFMRSLEKRRIEPKDEKPDPGRPQKRERPAVEVVREVESLASNPHLRFFHWDIEFPEVFFGFADADQRHLKHKNKFAAGSAGFDAVIGNPPYVRMERIKPVKPFLKQHYRCHSERADLFI